MTEKLNFTPLSHRVSEQKYRLSLAQKLCNRPLYNRWRKEQRHMAAGAIPRRRSKYQHPMLQLTFDFGCEIKEGRENIRERGVS